jgi:type 1 glutamine amidotransferase
MRTLLFILMLNFSFLNAQEKEVLVFHKTEGWHHESITTGIKAIKELGEENSFGVTETDDASAFTEEQLKKFDLVLFLNTSGNVLDEHQQKVFRDYMENGGNFFGIHAAADTEFEWEWYGELVGAYFVDHPAIQEATVKVITPNHPTVAHLPTTWKRTDEWYNYRNINPAMEVLLLLEEESYEGGKNEGFHPIAWYRELKGGGRTVYTGGGHTEESYSEENFREHLLQCILFAMGE